MFSWKTTVHGLSFKRAIDSIAPLLLEGRVVCNKKEGLDLCGIGDRLSVQYHVEFEGDEVSGTAEQVEFVLDLKEASAWLQVFRAGMTLEMRLDSKDELRLIFHNDAKTFEHETKLSNLCMPTDFVWLVKDEKQVCDELVDVSSPALAAVVKHHGKSSTHCSISVDGDSGKAVFKSVLRAVDPVKKSLTSIAGATSLPQLASPPFEKRDNRVTVPEDGEIYPLDLIKNVMKAYGFHDKKKGRVIVAVDHDTQKMTFIFKNDLSSWLVFGVLGAAEEEEAAPAPERTDSNASTVILSPRSPPPPLVIKRKKKKQKTEAAALEVAE